MKMRVVFIPKIRVIGLVIGLFIVAMFAVWGIYGLTGVNEISSGSFKIKESYPPLVYLPGYVQGPKVLASTAILIECGSSSVLYAKQAEIRRAPASTTKILTAIVALEKGNLKQIITVSRRAASTPGSSIWLRPGDRLTLAELLEGMLICSGNDGSMAVAEGVAGDMKQFVAWMNTKAREIGALNTKFSNPHGLRDSPHYTTALDLALITRYALTNPVFTGLVRQKSAKLEWEDGHRTVDIHNTNRLLWSMEGVDGVKTGTTNEAGYCLVASATRDGRQLIAVVLNSPDRWGDCRRLLEYGFRDFIAVPVADKRKPVARLKVIGGTKDSVALFPRSDLKAVLRKNDLSGFQPKISVTQDTVQAPVIKNRSYGRIGYTYHNQVIEGVDLIPEQSIRRKWWFW